MSSILLSDIVIFFLIFLIGAFLTYKGWSAMVKRKVTLQPVDIITEGGIPMKNEIIPDNTKDARYWGILLFVWGISIILIAVIFTIVILNG